jgi:hypothetical protein
MLPVKNPGDYAADKRSYQTFAAAQERKPGKSPVFQIVSSINSSIIDFSS